MLNRFLTLLTMVVLVPIFSHGQEGHEKEASRQTAAKFRSMYVINFTKYIDWPKGMVTDTFHIAVLNDSLVCQNLMTIAENRKVKGLPMVVKDIKSIEEAENSHLVYVDASSMTKKESILEWIDQRCILLISQGIESDYTMIGFFEDKGKLQYFMNKENMDKRGCASKAKLEELSVPQTEK